MSNLSLIVAVAENGVIGKDNAMPWHLPADLRRFKAVTMGKPLLMGRKTFDSLGRPLPGRPHVVISRDSALSLPEGVHLANSVESGVAIATTLAGPEDEVMVIGGAAIFAATLPIARRLYLTEIHRAFAGDTRFPSLDRSVWRETAREDVEGDPPFSFIVLEK